MLTILGALAAATPAMAAPVYLKCSIEQDGGPLQVNFVLDEETSRVAVIIPKTGAVDQVRGTFMIDRVLVPRDPSSFEISRTDLSVVRSTPMLKTTDRGFCKVEEFRKRAF
jgi:hypothetical protein